MYTENYDCCLRNVWSQGKLSSPCNGRMVSEILFKKQFSFIFWGRGSETMTTLNGQGVGGKMCICCTIVCTLLKVIVHKEKCVYSKLYVGTCKYKMNTICLFMFTMGNLLTQNCIIKGKMLQIYFFFVYVNPSILFRES